MYNGNQIKVLLAQQHLSPADLCEKILGRRDASTWQLVNGNPTAKTLEALADFFRVPIDVFFQREVVVDGQTPSSSFDSKYFQLLLETKDQIIAKQEEEIRLLKQQLGMDSPKRTKKNK